MTSFHKATLVSLVYVAFATFADAAQPVAQPVTVQIEQAARAQLERQLAAAGLAEPQFELALAAARPAPPCAQLVAVEALDTRQSAHMRFVARCPDPGGWRYEYLVRARVSALVAVAAGAVAVGEALTGEMVALERRDITNVSDPIGEVAQAVGQSSRRMLRAGDILRSSQLAAPLLVKRGDHVVMRARREGIEVSTSGEALDAGGRGATVRVKNSASGQVMRMRVTGPGTVEPLDATLTR